MFVMAIAAFGFRFGASDKQSSLVLFSALLVVEVNGRIQLSHKRTIRRRTAASVLQVCQASGVFTSFEL